MDLSGFAGWSLETRVVVPKASGFIIVVLVIVTLAAAAGFQDGMNRMMFEVCFLFNSLDCFRCGGLCSWID